MCPTGDLLSRRCGNGKSRLSKEPRPREKVPRPPGFEPRPPRIGDPRPRPLPAPRNGLLPANRGALAWCKKWQLYMNKLRIVIVRNTHLIDTYTLLIGLRIFPSYRMNKLMFAFQLFFLFLLYLCEFTMFISTSQLNSNALQTYISRRKKFSKLPLQSLHGLKKCIIKDWQWQIFKSVITWMHVPP